MYRKSFPKCGVEGSTEPVEFSCMVSKGAIPEKCVRCEFQFEASCTRAIDLVSDYQEFDHGPCKIAGETYPVEMLGPNQKYTYSVPAKCVHCEFLEFDDIREFGCGFDNDIWGDFRRSLDWGNWSPKYTPVGIDQKVIATDLLQEYIRNNKKAEAVKEIKRLYPPLSLNAAIRCIEMFKDRIENA